MCIVTAVAKLAVDSLVSSHVYEIIRTIYTSAAENDQARIQVLQQTLSQLRLTNIATLDACMNHFTRLIDLTSADEEYVAKLATSLAPCILRPRTETSLSMNEKHAYRLIRDLFAYKDAIFSELKRLSTQGSSGGGSVRGEQNRPRAISTDESNRKANMEERTRALLEKASGSRSRATSPAPSPRGHRRDKSSGGPETRFPIAASLTSPTTERNKRMSMGPVLPKRTSLEVPDEYGMGLSHPADGNFVPNGAAVVAEHAVAKAENDTPLEKRNSLGRSGARFVGGRRVGPAPSSLTSSSTPPPDNSQQGVTLVDRPMDY
jgi:hypothetical protein